MDRQTRARKGWDAQERRRGQAASNKSHHKHVPTCGHATEHCYTRRHSYHETPFSPTTRHKEYIPARHNPAQAVGVHRVGCARVGARARARGSSDERRDLRLGGGRALAAHCARGGDAKRGDSGDAERGADGNAGGRGQRRGRWSLVEGHGRAARKAGEGVAALAGQARERLSCSLAVALAVAVRRCSLAAKQREGGAGLDAGVHIVLPRGRAAGATGCTLANHATRAAGLTDTGLSGTAPVRVGSTRAAVGSTRATVGAGGASVGSTRATLVGSGVVLAGRRLEGLRDRAGEGAAGTERGVQAFIDKLGRYLLRRPLAGLELVEVLDAKVRIVEEGEGARLRPVVGSAHARLG
mmetsp:Transcript_6752/g.20306  ORF Transcript_6752/g.20306 Transcript_6752/m.20306 type:complete len:354 (+) Transcript_6752:223-1284(+)